MLKGIAASPGIAIGKVFLFEEDEFIIKKKDLSEEGIKKDIVRFRAAIIKVKEEMHGISKSVSEKLGKKHSRLFDAYAMMMEDPLLKDDIIRMVTKERVNVEYAVQFVINKISQSFLTINDEYLRERGRDIIDVGKKILRSLVGMERDSLKNITSEVIVVAHNLSPSDTISMRKNRVTGFAVDVGGKTSHTAILANSLGIPAVVGLKNITQHVKPDDMLIIDGIQGLVIINPDEITIKNYEREKKKFLDAGSELSKIRDLAAVTVDGHAIELSANIEIPDELTMVYNSGSAGIGLYRTEFLYLNRSDYPSEEEQYLQYAEVAKNVMPYSVIIRTLDIGADKLNPSIEHQMERNPFMGLRAVRYCLKHQDIFKTQLRAVLRASMDGKLKILFPMISGVDELRQVKQIFATTQNEMRNEGIPFNENIKIGIMIEVPSAAIIGDLLAKEVDFFSIGTNDLIQYLIAVDRVNENVADLYNPVHISVLRMIKKIIEDGHKEGKWVGMCGEMASDPSFTKILIGLGIDELSMSVVSIPKVKSIIRSISYSAAKELADEIMLTDEQEEIKNIIRRDELMKDNLS